MSTPGQGGEKPLRLTKDTRQALLNTNTGFKDSTYYSGKNFSEARQYEIVDGELHIHSNSKTSWADSRQQREYVADEATTHRFLSKNLPFLDTDGVAEEAAAVKAARKEAERVERRAAAAAAQTTPTTAEDPPGLLGAPVIGGRRLLKPNPSLGRAITIATMVGTAVWAAPPLKRAWVNQGKPRFEAWRERRATASADPVEQNDEGPEHSTD